VGTATLGWPGERPSRHSFLKSDRKDWSLGVVVRTDKLLARAGLAESTTEGSRKLRQKAVRINDELVEKSKLALPCTPYDLRVRAGRLLKHVHIA
jgi:tyrosyl-tRNA synthetase